MLLYNLTKKKRKKEKFMWHFLKRLKIIIEKKITKSKFIWCGGSTYGYRVSGLKKDILQLRSARVPDLNRLIFYGDNLLHYKTRSG